jgi:hypothetical protein
MISRAIYLKLAIEDICTKKSVVAQYNTRSLRLTREEWRILEEMSPLLGVRRFFFASAPALATDLSCRLSTTSRLKCKAQGYRRSAL